MCFWSTTASDPDLASTYRQYLCAAGIICSRSRGIYRLRRQPANTCHTPPSDRALQRYVMQIRSVRRCLPQHALLTLIRALVVSKVNYCCSVLAGVFGHLLDRLQSILNAAARLVFSARRSERITPLLRNLHWLHEGCGSRNGFNSVSAFWHSDVSMDQHCHISLRAFVGQPMWKVVATSTLLPP